MRDICTSGSTLTEPVSLSAFIRPISGHKIRNRTSPTPRRCLFKISQFPPTKRGPNSTLHFNPPSSVQASRPLGK